MIFIILDIEYIYCFGFFTISIKSIIYFFINKFNFVIDWFLFYVDEYHLTLIKYIFETVLIVLKYNTWVLKFKLYFL